MRKSNWTVHREMFRDTCLKTNTLLLKCKKDYFSKKISEIEYDQKQLHRLTNNLMGNKQYNVLRFQWSMLIDDGTKLRVVQFHNIYNRSFTILCNFTIVQIFNQISCVDFTKFADVQLKETVVKPNDVCVNQIGQCIVKCFEILV
jgi:hypothetical protein